MAADEDFKKYLPKITESTIVKAAQAFGEGGELLSLDGKRTALDAFVLQLATDGQVLGPFLLNKVCARELCAMLINAGFGPTEK